MLRQGRGAAGAGVRRSAAHLQLPVGVAQRGGGLEHGAHRARRRAATSRGPALRRCAAQPDYPVTTAASQPVWPLLLRFGADAPGWRSTGETPVGTVSFRTRWSLTEVFGWMWLARVIRLSRAGRIAFG